MEITSVVSGDGSITKEDTLSKQFYDAKEAHKVYERTRSDSRQGIDITPEELERLDAIISPLIKQGQSIHQICINKIWGKDVKINRENQLMVYLTKDREEEKRNLRNRKIV